MQEENAFFLQKWKRKMKNLTEKEILRTKMREILCRFPRSKSQFATLKNQYWISQFAISNFQTPLWRVGT